MGFGHWSGSVEFDSRQSSFAEMAAQDEYETYCITFNPAECVGHHDWEELVRHEFGHALFDGLSKFLEDIIKDMPSDSRKVIKRLWLRVEDKACTHVAKMPGLK